MNYKISYQQIVSRISIVKANNKNEAFDNFKKGDNILSDVQDDCDDAYDIEIEELE